VVTLCIFPSHLVDNSFICHEQCDSTFSCWGADDAQCDGCRNFRYLRRCVQNCSVVSLPDGSRLGLGVNTDEQCSVCVAKLQAHLVHLGHLFSCPSFLPPLLLPSSHPSSHMYTSCSGLYQNPTSFVCEECDEQCIGGCSGGTVSSLPWRHSVVYSSEISYFSELTGEF